MLYLILIPDGTKTILISIDNSNIKLICSFLNVWIHNLSNIFKLFENNEYLSIKSKSLELP